MKMNNKAFSLTELLVALGICVIFVAMILTVYSTVQQFYFTNVLTQRLQRDANMALDKIVNRKPAAGGYRLSEAIAYYQYSLAELRFCDTTSICTDTTNCSDNAHNYCSSYKLGSSGQSIVYHPAAAIGGTDQTIYTAPQGVTLTLRFTTPAPYNGAVYTNDVRVYVALSQTAYGKTVSGSADTLVNLRNHT